MRTCSLAPWKLVNDISKDRAAFFFEHVVQIFAEIRQVLIRNEASDLFADERGPGRSKNVGRFQIHFHQGAKPVEREEPYRRKVVQVGITRKASVDFVACMLEFFQRRMLHFQFDLVDFEFMLMPPGLRIGRWHGPPGRTFIRSGLRLPDPFCLSTKLGKIGRSRFLALHVCPALP